MTPKPIKLSKADVARFWSMVDKRGPNDCWEWSGGRVPAGYGRFYDCCGSQFQAHRIAFVLCNGGTELNVLHRCNHPFCCNPAHLYAGTQKDNIGQCVSEGRHIYITPDNRGEKHGRVKLTESKVRKIRRLYAEGWLQREIAEMFGIHQTHVGDICRKKKWKHV